jgi:hypothetical protein
LQRGQGRAGHGWRSRRHAASVPNHAGPVNRLRDARYANCFQDANISEPSEEIAR